MPLDKFDIKIQEAAKQYEPEFGEEAWAKMEKLLDVHLPQKEDDKKRFAWLFLLLFIVIGILLVIVKPWIIEGRGLIYPKGNIIVALANVIDAGVKNPNDLTENIIAKTKPSKNNPSLKITSDGKTSFLVMSGINNSKVSEAIQEPAGIKIAEEKVMVGDRDVVTEDNNIEPLQAINPGDTSQMVSNDKKLLNKKIGKGVVPDSSDKTGVIAVSKAKNNSAKSKRKFNNSFVLNFSAGPDVSAVRPANIGKINAVYGAGVGYNIGKRWSLRTGFYVTRKAYTAETSDYHPPTRFWSYYPNLEYIDADCKIYEVPLIVNFNFGQTPRHFWFGSAGVSSYFMKKEKYNYFPKDPTVPYLDNSYTVNNKNKHFLSSLRLSGGYATKLNNNVSIVAEPYINLPLSGVGFGKVKLYSAGVLFTLSVKPFAKK